MSPAKKTTQVSSAEGSPRYHVIASLLQERRETLTEPVRLPPEKALAEQHKVARDTIRRALELLERRGAVSRNRRRGTFLMPSAPRLAGGGEGSVVFIPPWWMASTTEWLTAAIFESTFRWATEHDVQLNVLHVPQRGLAPVELLEKLERRSVRGVLWCHPVPDQLELLQAVAQRLPCVVVGREYPEAGIHAAVADIGQAVRLIDDHLVAAGHVDYGVAGSTPLDPFSIQWIHGIQAAFARRNKHFDVRRYMDVQIVKRAQLAALLHDYFLPRLLPDVRALVLTASSYLRMIVNDDRLRSMIPEELSLIAFDFGDQPIHTYWPGRQVTHIHCDWSAIGQRAIDLLAMLMRGQLNLPQVVREPVELIEGDTVRPRGESRRPVPELASEQSGR